MNFIKHGMKKSPSRGQTVDQKLSLVRGLGPFDQAPGHGQRCDHNKIHIGPGKQVQQEITTAQTKPQGNQRKARKPPKSGMALPADLVSRGRASARRCPHGRPAIHTVRHMPTGPRTPRTASTKLHAERSAKRALRAAKSEGNASG